MAQIGNASDKAAIVALLDCDAIADASFRAAVAALHAGDVAELARLIDAEPRLLHERMMGPEAYRLRQRPGYFRDPKLIELLIERGARTDLRDTLWDATPLEWAMHGERSAAIAALERLG
jgi:hypothetical protein